jgi:hypothetical protein
MFMLAVLIPYGSGAPGLILNDPDNYMRLAQVRDWLGGQSWWDVTQYRINPPEGLTMHWSRIGDLPVAVALKFWEAIVGPEDAEWLAVSTVPPALLLAACCCLARAGHNLFGIRAAIFAIVAAAWSPHFMAEFVPGRIDHHGLQVLLLAVALAAITGQERGWNGIIAASAASASLVVGLEAAPYYVIIALWIVGRWAFNGARHQSMMLGFAAGMAVSLAVIYLTTIPPSDWARATYDEVGRGHLSIIVCTASLLAGLAYKSDLSTLTRLKILLFVSIVGAALLLTFPEVARPPYDDVDPLMQRLWIDNIIETKSFVDVWNTSPFEALAGIQVPIVLIIALAMLAKGGARKDLALLLALLLIVGLGIRIWQYRGGAIASVPSIVASGWVLAAAWKKWREGGGVIPFAISLVLLNGSILTSVAMANERKTETAKLAENANDTSCEKELATGSLNKLPAGLVLAPIGLSGPILVRSHHSVVTASNHRNYEPNRKAFEAFLAKPDSAKRQIGALKIDYVLFCRNGETDVLVKEAPIGLVGLLSRGETPDWLTLVEKPKSGTLRFYRVKPTR